MTDFYNAAIDHLAIALAFGVIVAGAVGVPFFVALAAVRKFDNQPRRSKFIASASAAVALGFFVFAAVKMWDSIDIVGACILLFVVFVTAQLPAVVVALGIAAFFPDVRAAMCGDPHVDLDRLSKELGRKEHLHRRQAASVEADILAEMARAKAAYLTSLTPTERALLTLRMEAMAAADVRASRAWTPFRMETPNLNERW